MSEPMRDFRQMSEEEKAARRAEWEVEFAQFAEIAAAAGPEFPGVAGNKMTKEREVQDIFRGTAADAAQAICDIATSGLNERTRLDAAKYVVERVMGRVGDAKNIEGEGDPWAGVFGAVTREPTAEERQRGMGVQ